MYELTTEIDTIALNSDSKYTTQKKKESRQPANNRWMNYSIALTLCLTPFKDLIFISTRHRITNHSILYISTTFFGIEKQPFSMPHLTQSLSHLHRWLRFFHMMPLTSVFLFCLFTSSSSVGLSCLLFPLNFRQPPPTYFIANKILYQSKRVACIKNRHEWKKTRPLYPRKYIKCPESFQSYQMHRTNFKICSQNNSHVFLELFSSSSSVLFSTNNSFVSRQTNAFSFHRCQSNDMREPFLS